MNYSSLNQVISSYPFESFRHWYSPIFQIFLMNNLQNFFFV